MNLIEQQTFIQPSGSRITLRRFGDPLTSFTCERLVDGQLQAGLYGSLAERAKQQIEDWEPFEYEIGSTKL